MGLCLILACFNPMFAGRSGSKRIKKFDNQLIFSLYFRDGPKLQLKSCTLDFSPGTKSTPGF